MSQDITKATPKNHWRVLVTTRTRRNSWRSPTVSFLFLMPKDAYFRFPNTLLSCRFILKTPFLYSITVFLKMNVETISIPNMKHTKRLVVSKTIVPHNKTQFSQSLDLKKHLRPAKCLAFFIS